MHLVISGANQTLMGHKFGRNDLDPIWLFFTRDVIHDVVLVKLHCLGYRSSFAVNTG